MKRAFSLAIALVSASTMVTIVALAMSQHSPTESTIGQVAIRLTTGNELYKFVTGTANFSPGSGSNPLKIQVTEVITYQQMDGIGAALTDSSAWLITNTPDITRTKILSDLFSPEGIGISYVRLPMGASDFVMTTTITPTHIITHYTYDDMPPGITDPDLISFTIAHDQPYIIPIIRQAMRLNPKLKVMASPWSAPAWMKSPQTLYGGSLNLQYCQDYANYFVKFIQAYEAEGIPIDTVTIQNEPYNPETADLTTDYPTMHMEPSEQAYFVRNCLGPAFAQHGIHAKILIWDHNWIWWNYPLAVLSDPSDPSARVYIDGSAWHCYSGTPAMQTIVHNAYPDKGIYFTECTGHGDEKFADDLAWGVYTVTISTIRNWAETVLYFNLALDENHGPHVGGCPDCRGLLTIGQNGAVTKTVEYYIVGHLSKFVDPGAVRIESSYITGTLESVAFQNPDKSIVLVVLNPSDKAKSFDVQWNGQFFTFLLEPKSVATFKWKMLRVYLPLVLNDYRSPVSFQNFEPDNGTPGAYFREVWYMTCLLDSTVAHEGRSLKCHAHAGDIDSHGGTVDIYPSSSNPVDLSSGKTFSIWVYDTQGHNDAELKLCDDDGCHGETAWSDNKAMQNNWTELTWQLSKFTKADKSKIRYIEIYEWNDGIYYFDDITWK
jgi:glucosylceramidase